MKENLTSKSWRWDKDLVNSEMTKIKNYNSVRFSAPVLNTKGDYAIMFVKFDSSIEARVYKRGWYMDVLLLLSLINFRLNFGLMGQERISNFYLVLCRLENGMDHYA